MSHTTQRIPVSAPQPHTFTVQIQIAPDSYEQLWAAGCALGCSPHEAASLLLRDTGVLQSWAQENFNPDFLLS